MSIEIRPATPPELTLVRDSWQHHMRPRYRWTKAMAPGHRGHAWGRDGFVGQSTMVEMFRRYMTAHANISDVLVLAVGGEAVGWASRSVLPEPRSACVVHYTLTLQRFRSEGIGSRLLAYIRQEARTAGVPVVPGVMTAAGLALWESEKSQ